MRRRESETKRHRFKKNEYKEPGPGVPPGLTRWSPLNLGNVLGRVSINQNIHINNYIGTFGEYIWNIKKLYSIIYRNNTKRLKRCKKTRSRFWEITSVPLFLASSSDLSGSPPLILPYPLILPRHDSPTLILFESAFSAHPTETLMDKVAAVLESGVPDSNQTDSRDSGV